MDNVSHGSVVPILGHAKDEFIDAGEEILSFGGTQVATLPAPGRTTGHLSVRVLAAGAVRSSPETRCAIRSKPTAREMRFFADAGEGLRLCAAHVVLRQGSALQTPLGVVHDGAGAFEWVASGALARQGRSPGWVESPA